MVMIISDCFTELHKLIVGGLLVIQTGLHHLLEQKVLILEEKTLSLLYQILLIMIVIGIFLIMPEAVMQIAQIMIILI